ncbi:hypothetical protein [Helicobacter pylori]|uniref:hypothetical protein n=1 Tax=Helicobacter pylori TaxID=210 RepID=UPI0002EA56F4|nr:hypothetical protein [Helicobacter pylori]
MPLLRFPLLRFMPCPLLPHILTMGRDTILQQTRFKALASHPKKSVSSLKINHKIPIPTI